MNVVTSAASGLFFYTLHTHAVVPAFCVRKRGKNQVCNSREFSVSHSVGKHTATNTEAQWIESNLLLSGQQAFEFWHTPHVIEHGGGASFGSATNTYRNNQFSAADV